MRICLFFLVLITGAMCQSGKGGGERKESNDSSGGNSDKKARKFAGRRDWSGRKIGAGEERVYGWGVDKRAPTLRISDKDRAKPARDRTTWMTWRKKFGGGRSYRNSTHEELHARIFEQTEKMVEEHNAAYDNGEVSYTLAVNDLADLTEEEYDRMSNNAFKEEYLNGLNTTDEVNATEESISHTRVKRAPASFDWRSQGVISPIKNQGGCGSCYAFACMAVVESLFYRKGQKVDFSEQEIVDCSYKKYMGNNHNGGCAGGWPTAVFEHLVTNGALNTPTYPYTSGNSGKQGECKRGTMQTNFKIKTNFNIRPRTEQEIVDILISKGPVVVALAADNEHKDTWMAYSSGVFDGCTPNLNPNHAVVIVGYGTEKGRDYWIIRNSWGTSWGESGYMKLARGTNMCNYMAFGLWYPTLE